MNQTSIRTLLRTKRLYCDGGFGTLLQKAGLGAGEAPENWNLTHPEIITELHRAYVNAGANIITTNTFGVHAGKQENWAELLKAGIECAKKAVADVPEAFVALDIGPLGVLLEPYGTLPFEDAVASFAENIKLGASCGADLILIETMNDSYETKAAVLAAKENCDLPIFVTNAYGEDGKLMTGATPEAMSALLEGLGVDAFGMNCSFGPDKMIPVAKRLCACSHLPLIANPNAGLPTVVNGKNHYEMDAAQFSDYAVQLAECGISLLGGCCGTEPEYIAQVVAKTKEMPLPQANPEVITVVSSYTEAVQIGKAPVRIGERINPTGKKRMKEALRGGDYNTILQEAIRQAEAGVEILDVNAGLPDIDESGVLCKCVREIQAVCSVPLQIDTGSPEAMARALRIYNGKPLVNSVNAKAESMHAIFPLVQKYGGTVIALTLDENGIPKTAQERVALAEKIIQTAKTYGIAPNDIVVDPLTLTVSSDPESAKVTLETVRLLHEKNIRTSLGVSNVSFGLPRRELLNAVFYANALENGLDCAIMNPFAKEMQEVYTAFRALHGMDASCADYIAFADAQPTAQASPQAAVQDRLMQCIIDGRKEAAVALAEQMLTESAPLAVIKSELIPALDAVGKDYETGKRYLPQLLMSAEAASAAFEVIRKRLPASEGNGRKMILATVEGDIHDIGKNIVRTLLESYGFTVIDLGRDVPAEAVAEAVVRENCRLVGLSALMTTTVPAMERTIRLLHQKDAGIRVVVGGAVLTASYAKQIGADCYAPDAMDTVRYAEEFYR